MFLNATRVKTLHDTAVDTYSSTIQFVPDEYKTQKICDKAVDTYPFVFDSVHD